MLAGGAGALYLSQSSFWSVTADIAGPIRGGNGVGRNEHGRAAWRRTDGFADAVDRGAFWLDAFVPDGGGFVRGGVGTVAGGESGRATGQAQRLTFLTAEWRYVAMLNWEIDPSLLAPHVPYGTELDELDGRTFVSLVGFRFLNTRVLGMSIPFHRDFDEVNLRFYVRRREAGLRRGVVFIREIVPRWAIATVARLAYSENYRSLPMSHHIHEADGALEVEYAWRLSGAWHWLSIRAKGEPRPMVEVSLEQFIAEHYWGYSARSATASVEYQVAHPAWRVWDVTGASDAAIRKRCMAVSLARCFGGRITPAVLAEGSPVEGL